MPALPWLPLLAPLALIAAGLAPAGWARRAPLAMGGVAQAAAGVALLSGLAGAGAVAVCGPLGTGTLSLGLSGAGGVGAGLYLDALSAIVAVLVAFIGLIIVRFSATYLHGDPEHGRFLRLLCRTLAAVLLLVVSGNLAQLALAWIAVSLALHRLLLFYPGRPAAVLAARKKFVVSRLGDGCVIAAAILLHRAAGTLDIAALQQAGGATLQMPMELAAVLLACAALLKSAAFPLHGWLLEVMETPTPVSALLHAGVINAGGFLLLRLAPVVAAAPAAMHLLMLAGAVTAVFGAACMLPQSAVKTALAYSTIAQMGFMLLECGLGVFQAALLHIAAHALYKAHAFLASGSVLQQPPAPAAAMAPAMAVARIMAALALGVAAWLCGAPEAEAALLVLLLCGVGLWRGGPAAAGVVALSLLWHLAALALPGVAVPQPDGVGTVLIGVIVLAFAGAALAQATLPRWAGSPAGRALQVHLAQGLYVNTIANRLALRLWPAPRPEPAAFDLPLLGRTGGTV